MSSRSPFPDNGFSKGLVSTTNSGVGHSEGNKLGEPKEVGEDELKLSTA